MKKHGRGAHATKDEMISEQLEFQISQYAGGTLPADEVAALEVVLASDPAARAMLDEYRKLDVMLKREMPLPEVRWDRLAEHLSAAVAEEDRSTTTYKIGAVSIGTGSIGKWSRRLAVAAALLLAAGVFFAWPGKTPHTTITTGPDKPVAVAVVDIGGPVPEAAAQPAIAEIAISPSAIAEQTNYSVAETIVYHAPRVTIASAAVDRQDTPRLPY
jgi:hypothetical protein